MSYYSKVSETVPGTYKHSHLTFIIILLIHLVFSKFPNYVSSTAFGLSEDSSLT